MTDPRTTVITTDLTAAETTSTSTLTSRTQETEHMLLHEYLSRIRMREDQRVAARERAANRLLAIRRWERVAGWAAERAARARAR